MRRRFIFSECERRNRSGVPPRSAWVKLAGPLPVNVSLLGAPGLRLGAPFLFVRPFDHLKNCGLHAGGACGGRF